MGASLFLALLLAAQTHRPTLRDFTFLPIFEKVNPRAKYFAELKRMGVAGDQDLVVMLASPQKLGGDAYEGEAPWTAGALVGVFLQSYAEPPEITTLALLPDACACRVRVARAREDEIVLSRAGAEQITLFIDVRAKKLLAKKTYQPFAVRGLVERDGLPTFIASDGQKGLTVRPNAGETGFDLVAEQEAIPSLSVPLVFGPEKRFRLSQEGGVKLIQEVSSLYPLPNHQEMGPHQLWGDKLWFGTAGGFGFFDGTTAAYTLFTPPEASTWSVSALRVETGAVWLGLTSRSESGGLLRWDRITHQIQKYPLPSVANAIYQTPNALYVATQDGIAVLRTGHQFFENYIVDVTANGGYRVVPAF